MKSSSRTSTKGQSKLTSNSIKSQTTPVSQIVTMIATGENSTSRAADQSDQVVSAKDPPNEASDRRVTVAAVTR